MTWDDVVAFTADWPKVEVSTSYGEPALKVRGKLLCRHRTDENALVLLGVTHEERAHLVDMMPDVCYFTAHYENYEIVLARFANAQLSVVGRHIANRWNACATQTMRRTFTPPTVRT